MWIYPQGVEISLHGATVDSEASDMEATLKEYNGNGFFLLHIKEFCVSCPTQPGTIHFYSV